MKIKILFVSVILFLFSGGCIKLKHEMTIQPIHVTVEIKVKIDRELENFFGDIDQTEVKAKETAKPGEEKKEDKHEN